MQPKSNKRQTVLIGVLILLIIFAGYFFFMRGANDFTVPEIAFDEFGNPVQATVVGQDLITLLEQLEGVQLDNSLFSSPSFVLLTDYAIELPVIPQGRDNPFITPPGL